MAEKTPKRKVDYANAWKEARSLVGRYRGRLAIGFALMIVNRGAGLVLPGSSKFVIDEVIGKQRADLLLPIGLAVAGATLLQASTTFALSRFISVAAQEAIMDMRRRVQAHVTRLPVRFFDDNKTGNLISRIMSDAEGIRNLVGTGIIQLTGGVLTALLALGVLFYLNWQLTTFTLIVLSLFGGVMAYAFSRLRPIFRQRSVINAEVTGRLSETLSGIRIVKAYSAEDREQAVFSEGVDRLFNNVKSSITGVSLVTAFGSVIIGVVGLVMILVGGRAILTGEMTLGDFVMYVFFTGLMAAPIIQMASIGTQMSDALAGLDRISELFGEQAEDALDHERRAVGEVGGKVEFRHVWFRYEPDTPVLQDVSFVAPPGSTTALVGSSGSGKSTLASLVLAFNRPDDGAVLVDGLNLTEVQLSTYRLNLGVVLQENFLFDGSVADNVRFARPEATDKDVEDVCRLAHCHDFIVSFPSGYETVVGERGVKLSGGQKQRVAIARALLADPRILVLDEATSSLDSESEGLIQQGLNSLRHGRTTFVIAHRLSTIRSADQILVLEEGRIMEQGSHESLYALGGRYRDLYDQQHAWEVNTFVNPGEDYLSTT